MFRLDIGLLESQLSHFSWDNRHKNWAISHNNCMQLTCEQEFKHSISDIHRNNAIDRGQWIREQ